MEHISGLMQRWELTTNDKNKCCVFFFNERDKHRVFLFEMVYLIYIYINKYISISNICMMNM